MFKIGDYVKVNSTSEYYNGSRWFICSHPRLDPYSSKIYYNICKDNDIDCFIGVFENDLELINKDWGDGE